MDIKSDWNSCQCSHSTHTGISRIWQSCPHGTLMPTALQGHINKHRWPMVHSQQWENTGEKSLGGRTKGSKLCIQRHSLCIETFTNISSLSQWHLSAMIILYLVIISVRIHTTSIFLQIIIYILDGDIESDGKQVTCSSQQAVGWGSEPIGESQRPLPVSHGVFQLLWLIAQSGSNL